MQTSSKGTTLGLLGLVLAALVCSSSGGTAQDRGPFAAPRSREAPLAPGGGRGGFEEGSLNPRTDDARLLPMREWTIRETAADSLWRIGRPAVPALIESLLDRDPYVRLLADSALAHIGSDAEEAVPQLILLLEDESEAVRRQAARALGQIGPPAARAVPSLIQKMRAPAR